MRIRPTVQERYLLAVILIAYAILAITYSVVTPLFEASDELWHYPFVKFIADTRGVLPIQDPANVELWKQEGGQPPLYYYLGALLTFWIDTSDMPAVRRENPHVDNGIITADGNINLVVHNAQAEAFPWRGAALAVHIVRLLSVVMGVGTVYCTYALARELFPDRAEIALGAAALVAFTPMFLFISGSVNNDNLAMLLAGMLLLLLVRLTRDPASVGLQNFAVIGVVAGAGLLTKPSLGFLLPLAGVAFVCLGFKSRNWRLAAQGTLLAAFLTILIAGWWYQRNVVLYSDVTGLNVFVEILGRRQVPADLAQLWRERTAFVSGYWGLFGGLNVPMASLTYPIFNAVGLFGLVGLVIHLARRLRFPRTREAFRNLLTWDFGVGIRDLLALAWPVLVFVSWTHWASVTWSSQGRLVFSAITAITVWLTVGLTAWFPRRYGSWALGAAAAFFLLCAALAPFAWIAPAYAPSPELTPDQIAAIPNRLDADFCVPDADAPAMRLLGFKLPQTTAQPGDQLPVTLYWEVLAPMSRDWSVFVHLEDPNRTPVAQRDTYPGVGLLAAGDLLPGRTFANRYVIEIPAVVYTPDTLTLTVGLYDYATCPACARMRTAEGDYVRLHEVLLRAAPSPHGVPNPLSVNFGDRAELVGYALDRRQALPGETITLTLYWQGLRQMEVNYTVFAHVLGENNRIWANGDSWPAGGAAPTSAWTPGEIVEDAHALTLAPETPSGVYPIEVGLYVRTDDGGFERLVVVTGEGTLQRDFVYLSRVRVGQ
jgi:4-amino-4-deoxy-L-arabinose transferase-like glycosyltransferase